MKKKGYILVNLGQFEYKTLLRSIQIRRFWSKKIPKEIQRHIGCLQNNTHTYTHTHIYIYVYLYIIYTYIYIYVYIYIYIYLFIYIYIYIYI